MLFPRLIPPNPMRLFRSVWTHTAALALVLLLAGWGLVAYYQTSSTKSFVEKELALNNNLARLFANSIFPRHKSYLKEASAHPEAAKTNPSLPQLIKDVHDMSSGLRLLRLEIFNEDGIAIFSTDPARIGQKNENHSNIRRALAGESHGNLVFNKAFKSPKGSKMETNAMQTYVPTSLRPEDQREIPAVLVISSDVSELLNDIQEGVFEAARVTSIVGLALFIAVLLLLRRASRNSIVADPLTGLPGRLQALETLNEALSRGKRKGAAQAACLVVGIDRLKTINSALGHAAGDEVLRQAAKRLASLGEHGFLFRVGSDAFGLAIDGPNSLERARASARKAINLFQTSMEAAGREVGISQSCGISWTADGSIDAERLLRHAESARQESKSHGSGQISVYTDGLEKSAAQKIEIETGLRQAIRRQEFEVFYQPLACAENSSILSVEALIRWRKTGADGKIEIIPPSYFVPVLEETGLIIPVGAWVLEEACRQCKIWRDTLAPHMRVSVNLSARQFHSESLYLTVQQALEKAGLDPKALDIELTESSLAGDPQRAARILSDLKDLGVTISIDDFGTGYSSLSYLRHFPIDGLKIDKSFIQDAPHNKDDAAITKAISSMAKHLELGLVAEGIETDAQAAFARSMGCEKLQGFLFSRPVTHEELTELLKSGSKTIFLTPSA